MSVIKDDRETSFLDHPSIKIRGEVEARMKKAIDHLDHDRQLSILLAWIPSENFEPMLSVNENKS